ncbi:hypothetical protein ABT126_08705 [Streptomyces sp. NPDC002012]
MTRAESKAYEVPGATGPGITIYVHERDCSMPRTTRPRTYH